MSDLSITKPDSGESGMPKGELGLRPRMISAAWFSVAAIVPVVFFFLTFGGVWTDGFAHIELWSLWFFCAIPISAAALCGFSVGYRIIDPMNETTAWRAALRGALVAILSYVLFMAAYGVLAVVLSGSRQNGSVVDTVSTLLTIFLIGVVLVGWLILISGAVAGWLLFVASKRSA